MNPPEHKTPTILLVEDHADTRNILVRLLRTRGYEVEWAGTGKAARELLASRQFDVLLCDIGLPDENGCDLMRELKSLYPIAGIALTGYAMDEDLQHCRDSGFAAHIIKPFRFDDLAATVERIVGGELGRSP